MSVIDPKDLVKAGLGTVQDLVQYADLPGGPVTNELVRTLIELGKSSLDAHDTAEEALVAIRVALSGYGAEKARERFGDG